MPLELYPAVIWTRDDYAGAAVDRWYRCQDERARMFVRLARDWEHVRDHLRLYARRDFADDMENIGVQPSMSGAIVNLVIVASAMGEDAYTKGDDDSKLVQSMEQEVAGIQRHVVLLAQHDGLRNNDRRVQAPSAFGVPWLISSKVSDGRTADDEDIATRLGLVLDVVTLTSPRLIDGDIGALQRFMNAEVAEGHVRMAGSARVDYGKLMDDISRGCGEHVFAHCRSLTNVAPNQARAFLQGADANTGALVRGEIDVASFLGRTIGAEGLAGWSAQSILVEGHELLLKLVDENGLLARGASGEALLGAFVDLPVDWPWWKRLLAALGLMRRPPRRPSKMRAGQAAACGVALSALQEAADYLTKATRLAMRGSQCAYDPPRRFVERWTEMLGRGLQADLNMIADIDDVRSPDPERVFRDLNSRIEIDVSENMSEAISHWTRNVPDLEQVRALLGSERLVIFDGHLPGGANIAPAAVIGSFRFGDRVSIHGREVPYACVRAWRGVKPMFMVVSESVTEKNLRW